MKRFLKIRFSGIAKSFRSGRQLLTGHGVIYLGLIFAITTLSMRLLEVCSCTVFTLASAAAILLSVLLVGSSTFQSISGEREKKTLDS